MGSGIEGTDEGPRIDPRVRDLAWQLFLEAFKVALRLPPSAPEWVADDQYRACLRIAKMVVNIEREKPLTLTCRPSNIEDPMPPQEFIELVELFRNALNSQDTEKAEVHKAEIVSNPQHIEWLVKLIPPPA